jgi:3-phosphoshikimate 1-carboxyvinyltransferase
MVLGALTHSNFVLKKPLISEDTKATLDALFALGTEVRHNSQSVTIHCEKLRPSPGVIDARNSGTTMRLVTGLASLLPAETVLTGDQSLVARPMGPLVDALVQLGAKCSYLGRTGNPPLKVQGPIKGSRAEIPAGVSSQFISSLLIACTQKERDTEVVLKGPTTSRPYIDITLRMLEEFGASVDEQESGFVIGEQQELVMDSYAVPGDYSSAAFTLAAAAITGGDVAVRNLDEKSPQGDKAMVQHLRAFGAKVAVRPESIRVKGERLHGAEIDVSDTPDLFPVLAVVGSAADGRTVISGGKNLRQKESDRIETTAAFLRAMGARVLPKDDGCEILGGDKLHGATVDTKGDHRILMAAAVAGLVCTSETRIEDDESYKISYPGFMRDMHQIGCRLEVRK